MNLKATQVVPSLETPIPKGKNAIWCASFLCAWKTLAENVAKEPLAMEGISEFVAWLNQARDPRPDIPPAALCAAAGWVKQGIVPAIQKELAEKFPLKQLPMDGLPPNALIAYSYLEAQVKFPAPYLQYGKPLVFTDAAGRKTSIKSFGVPDDARVFGPFRDQALILFSKRKPGDQDGEFAVDLCANSSPNQIIVAQIHREPTLAAALARLEQESNSRGSKFCHSLSKTQRKRYLAHP